MKISMKINGKVIARDVSAYVIHRELSQYIGEGKKMCDNCSNLLSCSHRSVNRPFIKRAVQFGKKEAYVTECGNYSPLSASFVPGKGLPDSMIPSSGEATIRRYVDVYSASIAHPAVKELVYRMK